MFESAAAAATAFIPEPEPSTLEKAADEFVLLTMEEAWGSGPRTLAWGSPNPSVDGESCLPPRKIQRSRTSPDDSDSSSTGSESHPPPRKVQRSVTQSKCVFETCGKECSTRFNVFSHILTQHLNGGIKCPCRETPFHSLPVYRGTHGLNGDRSACIGTYIPALLAVNETINKSRPNHRNHRRDCAKTSGAKTSGDEAYHAALKDLHHVGTKGKKNIGSYNCPGIHPSAKCIHPNCQQEFFPHHKLEDLLDHLCADHLKVKIQCGVCGYFEGGPKSFGEHCARVHGTTPAPTVAAYRAIENKADTKLDYVELGSRRRRGWKRRDDLTGLWLAENEVEKLARITPEVGRVKMRLVCRALDDHSYGATSATKTYRCFFETCDRRYTSLLDLLAHYFRHHLNGEIKCSCGNICRSLDVYRDAHGLDYTEKTCVSTLIPAILEVNKIVDVKGHGAHETACKKVDSLLHSCDERLKDLHSVGPNGEKNSAGFSCPGRREGKCVHPNCKHVFKPPCNLEDLVCHLCDDHMKMKFRCACGFAGPGMKDLKKHYQQTHTNAWVCPVKLYKAIEEGAIKLPGKTPAKAEVKGWKQQRLVPAVRLLENINGVVTVCPAAVETPTVVWNPGELSSGTRLKTTTSPMC